MIDNNLSQTMGFCNAMMTGFIMINILVGATLILLPLPSAIKIGVLFFWYFCGSIYMMEHILLYTYLKYEEIPPEMHNYGLRNWSLEEEGIHNQQAIQDYKVDKIAHRINVLSSETPKLIDCCCAPNFVNAKAKQSSIGALKGLVSSILMFCLGSFVIKEVRKRRREEQIEKVLKTNPNDILMENDRTNLPQQYYLPVQDQNIKMYWTQNLNRQTWNQGNQFELKPMPSYNQAYEAERVEQFERVMN